MTKKYSNFNIFDALGLKIMKSSPKQSHLSRESFLIMYIVHIKNMGSTKLINIFPLCELVQNINA